MVERLRKRYYTAAPQSHRCLSIRRKNWHRGADEGRNETLITHLICLGLRCGPPKEQSSTQITSRLRESRAKRMTRKVLSISLLAVLQSVLRARCKRP